MIFLAFLKELVSVTHLGVTKMFIKRLKRKTCEVLWKNKYYHDILQKKCYKILYKLLFLGIFKHPQIINESVVQLKKRQSRKKMKIFLNFKSTFFSNEIKWIEPKEIDLFELFKNVHVFFITIFFRRFMASITENRGLFFAKLLSLSFYVGVKDI